LDQSLTNLRLNYADEVKKGDTNTAPSKEEAQGDTGSGETKED
jgi:hypothetical protein